MAASNQDNWLGETLDRIITKLNALEIDASAQRDILNRILTLLEPPPAYGFTVTLSIDKRSFTMAKKASAPAPSLTINDDGTATITLNFTDADGLPITGLTALPAGVATPVFASSDQTPGPSAFTITPAANNLSAAIAVVQPVVLPPAQNVDFTVTIASGLVNQTSPVTEDAGTLSIVADANQVSGFAAVISEP